jgi:hypothetical protein
MPPVVAEECGVVQVGGLQQIGRQGVVAGAVGPHLRAACRQDGVHIQTVGAALAHQEIETLGQFAASPMCSGEST